MKSSDTIVAKSNMKSEGYPYGKTYSYYVLLLLSCLMLFDFIDRQVLSSVLVLIKAEWLLSDAQLSGLMGIVNISIALLALPSAVLVDRWSRKKMVGLMAVIWSVACLACVFSGSYLQLLMLRFVLGAGEAGYGPGASSMIQDMFPENKRSGALGIFNAMGPLGGIAGLLIGGFIAQRWGWRHAIGLVAIPGLLIAILVFFLKEPVHTVVQRVNKDTGQTEKVPLMTALKKLLTTRTLVFIYLAMAMSLILAACIGLWMPAYFARTGGLGVQDAATKASLVSLMSVIGAMLGGRIADKLLHKHPAAPLMCAAVFMLITSLSLAFAFLVLSPEVAFPFILLGGLFMNAAIGPAYTSIMNACHSGLRATALGLSILVQNILGMALGVFFSGFLSDFFARQFVEGKLGNAALYIDQGPEALNAAAQSFGLTTALGTIAIVPLCAVLCFFLASRFYRKDCAAAEVF